MMCGKSCDSDVVPIKFVLVVFVKFPCKVGCQQQFFSVLSPATAKLTFFRLLGLLTQQQLPRSRLLSSSQLFQVLNLFNSWSNSKPSMHVLASSSSSSLFLPALSVSVSCWEVGT
jgi:hypothetical protein